MSLPKDARIVIIGAAGTFGASTALALARRGYVNVVALDAHAPPSEVSAGNDLNKILGNDTLSPFYLAMAKRITQAWRTDPVYQPFFRQVGRIKASDGPDTQDGHDIRRIFAAHCADPFYQDTLALLPTGEDVRKKVPQLEWLGTRPDWFALYNGVEGWVHARGALLAVATEAQRLGVQYITGDAGKVVHLEPWHAPVGPQSGPRGVRFTTQDGTVWTEPHVILCAGAWAPALVDMQRQVLAKCWTVGHIQLTPQEAAPLKGLPVIHHPVRGFFFEPSADNKIKICNEYPGYTCWNGRVSAPPETKYAVPEVCFREIRQLLQDWMPRFAHKPITDAMICWCTDASDEDMLFDFHPSFGPSGLLLATADCGNGFHRMPLIGEYISDALLGLLPPEEKNRWRWRPDVVPKDPRDFAPWRPGEAKELTSLPGWPMTVDPTVPAPHPAAGCASK